MEILDNTMVSIIILCYRHFNFIFDAISSVAACATPVPGGIGNVTTAVLARRLVNAALAQEEAGSEK